MNKDQFLEYIDHFNNRRYDALRTYFAPDITVEYFDNYLEREIPARTLHGPEEFIDSYRTLHEYVREVSEVGDFLVSEDRLFAELYVEFHCIRDNPPESLKNRLNRYQLKRKGDVFIWMGWVLYNLENDKMKRIRIAYHRMHDPKLARL